MRLKKKKVALAVVATMLLLALALAVWAFFIEPDRIVVHEETIAPRGWPTAFDRLKIAVISDLHAGSPHINKEKLQAVVAKTNELQPDLILLPGDFVVQESVLGGKFVEPDEIASSLKELRAPLGVYAVLGNHDWWFNGERVRAALEAAGIRVLENDVTQLERNGEKIWLAGLADLWTRKQDIQGTLAKAQTDAAVIAFTHNPDVFPLIPARVSLTIAGHTHGGQVNIPFLGRRVVPSSNGERYAAGHIIEDGRHLFVTTGIGTSIFPVRFRVAPEIALLTISSK